MADMLNARSPNNQHDLVLLQIDKVTDVCDSKTM